MKVTNTILALAYAAIGAANAQYVASSAPARPAPQMPPAVITATQSIFMTPIPIVIADFIYSPAVSSSAVPSLPRPSVPSAPAPAPAPAPVYVAHPPPAPAVPTAIAAPSQAPAEPAPTASQRTYVSHKRDIDQDSMDNLVDGKGAMMFNIDGKSYMLVRLPVDLAKQVADSDVMLRKRATSDDLIADATTKDLDSASLLYDLLGKVFARVIVPVNVNIGISDPEDSSAVDGLARRDFLDNLLGEVIASVVAPINIVADINPDEDGNGLVPNLLGRVSATVQVSPTVTLHIFDSDKNNSADDELLRRDLVEDLLGEIIASAVAPINIVANINPDEDGNGLVPNLLGRVSATVQVSPTITAHLFDSDKNDNELLRRDLIEDLLGEVVASAVAPINIVANINPDEDGNGLVPNLLGRVSATVQVSPTVTAHLFDSEKDSDKLLRRDFLDNLLGEVIASVVAPINIVANINPDEDGNGLVPNLLGRVSATVQVSPTITAHIFDSDKDNSANDELMRRDLLEDLLGEVVASAVAPINIVANINPDEDGNGLVPNLLGRVSATVQVSPTVTAHLFDSEKDSDKLLRRDFLDNLLGEVIASVVAPVNIVANINPDEDGNGLVPNLLGRVSATIQASPTVTLHIFDSDKDESEALVKRSDVPSGIYTEKVDDMHIAIYVPLSTLTKHKSQPNVASLVSAVGSESVQIVSVAPTLAKPMSSAPTHAATEIQNDIYLRIVVPKSSLV
ncbi:hypothetical protein LPJ59_003350 [Coemansia sp. RSA 2399]|nr:hypothetical protein LPJ59_003350 [Coemansia sp. RSA 2399]KAJ1898806.1 hypothetical protein LPJ81_004262 [Coemansia sp. IMI 209127]